MTRVSVAAELSVLAALTLAFLLLFPERPFFVDVGLALSALVLLLLNARYTKDVIWGQFPCGLDRRSRFRKTFAAVGPVTGMVVAALFAMGLALGYLEGGWETAAQRVGSGHLLVAVALYFPWALLQQTLFQFYLLGRLRTLFPRAVAVTGAGIGYALVHLPEVEITIATAVAGVFWSHVYDRYRVLSPLALSHAMLGSTLYYWVYGRDLVQEWTIGW